MERQNSRSCVAEDCMPSAPALRGAGGITAWQNSGNSIEMNAEHNRFFLLMTRCIDQNYSEPKGRYAPLCGGLTVGGFGGACCCCCCCCWGRRDRGCLGAGFALAISV